MTTLHDPSLINAADHVLSGEPPWGLGIDPDFADMLIEEEDADALVVDVLDRHERAKAVMNKAQPLSPQGRPPKESDKTFGPKVKYGESASYLAARLKRDAPHIAGAVERGEYPSIRSAAIAAGIVKPLPSLETRHS